MSTESDAQNYFWNNLSEAELDELERLLEEAHQEARDVVPEPEVDCETRMKQKRDQIFREMFGG